MINETHLEQRENLNNLTKDFNTALKTILELVRGGKSSVTPETLPAFKEMARKMEERAKTLQQRGDNASQWIQNERIEYGKYLQDNQTGRSFDPQEMQKQREILANTVKDFEDSVTILKRIVEREEQMTIDRHTEQHAQLNSKEIEYNTIAEALNNLMKDNKVTLSPEVNLLLFNIQEQTKKDKKAGHDAAHWIQKARVEYRQTGNPFDLERMQAQRKTLDKAVEGFGNSIEVFKQILTYLESQANENDQSEA